MATKLKPIVAALLARIYAERDALQRENVVLQEGNMRLREALKAKV